MFEPISTPNVIFFRHRNSRQTHVVPLFPFFLRQPPRFQPKDLCYYCTGICLTASQSLPLFRVHVPARNCTAPRLGSPTCPVENIFAPRTRALPVKEKNKKDSQGSPAIRNTCRTSANGKPTTRHGSRRGEPEMRDGQSDERLRCARRLRDRLCPRP